MPNYIFNSILSPEEVNGIVSALNPKDGKIETSHYYKGSVGFYNLPVTNQYLGRIEDLVMPLFDYRLKFENSFTRIYINDSHLGFHIDRPQLDVTMSLCLKRDVAWPLCVSIKEADNNYSESNFESYIEAFEGYDVKPGSAVVCEGRRFPHWREPLVCAENQENIYVFFHWSKT